MTRHPELDPRFGVFSPSLKIRSDPLPILSCLRFADSGRRPIKHVPREKSVDGKEDGTVCYRHDHDQLRHAKST